MTLIRAAPCCLRMDVIKDKKNKTLLARRLNTSQSHLPPPPPPSPHHHRQVVSSDEEKGKKGLTSMYNSSLSEHFHSGHSRQSRPLLQRCTSFFPSSSSSSSVVVVAQLLEDGGGGVSVESRHLKIVAASSAWQPRGRTVKERSSTCW